MGNDLSVLECVSPSTPSRLARLRSLADRHRQEISLTELILLEMHMTGIQIPEPLRTALAEANHDMRPNAGDVNLRFLSGIKDVNGSPLRAEIPTIVRSTSPYLWDGIDLNAWDGSRRGWRALQLYPELVIRGPAEHSFFYERAVTSRGQRVLNLNENNGGCPVNCPLCPKSSLARAISVKRASTHRLTYVSWSSMKDCSTLARFDEIAVVTNAFETEEEAVGYLEGLVDAAIGLSFDGTVVWYGFNIRSEDAIANLAHYVHERRLRLRFIYTIETFERPFNAGPKRIPLDEAESILIRAGSYADEVLFSHIVGLDTLETMEREMDRFIGLGTSPILSDFFLADRDRASKVLKGDARDLEYYVRAREIIRSAIERHLPEERWNFAIHCESNASPFFFQDVGVGERVFRVPGGRTARDHPLTLSEGPRRLQELLEVNAEAATADLRREALRCVSTWRSERGDRSSPYDLSSLAVLRAACEIRAEDRYAARGKSCDRSHVRPRRTRPAGDFTGARHPSGAGSQRWLCHGPRGGEVPCRFNRRD